MGTGISAALAPLPAHLSAGTEITAAPAPLPALQPNTLAYQPLGKIQTNQWIYVFAARAAVGAFLLDIKSWWTQTYLQDVCQTLMHTNLAASCLSCRPRAKHGCDGDQVVHHIGCRSLFSWAQRPFQQVPDTSSQCKLSVQVPSASFRYKFPVESWSGLILWSGVNANGTPTSRHESSHIMDMESSGMVNFIITNLSLLIFDFIFCFVNFCIANIWFHFLLCKFLYVR